MNALDILKKTPKTNCGDCGYPACMAFAVAVVSGGESLRHCPYIQVEAISEEDMADSVQHVSDPDTVLLKSLKAKVRSIDIGGLAHRLGGEIVTENNMEMLRLSYLGDTVFISSERIISSAGNELDPRDQILLYNYLFFGGAGDLSNEWVGLESFPNSISKVVTLRRYTEEKLAAEFTGRIDRFKEVLERLCATDVMECHADMCMVVPVLPRVPIQVHFWDADDDDGFPASVKMLFDSNALEFLDIESLIFAAERITEKACELA